MISLQGTLFGFDAVLLTVLLVPGYLSLRGYLNATVQLDTVPRLDKVLLAAVAGAVTLGLVSVGVRFGVLGVLDSVIGQIPPEGVHRPLRVTDLGTVPVSSLVGLVVAQSGIGYVLGYLVGTAVHVSAPGPQRSDIRQPWETVVGRLTFGDEVIAVTERGARIRGRVARVGSPSESADLLLWAAVRDRGDTAEPVGTVYLDSRSVTRVELDAEPTGGLTEGNWILRQWRSIVHRIDGITTSLATTAGRLWRAVRNRDYE